VPVNYIGHASQWDEIEIEKASLMPVASRAAFSAFARAPRPVLWRAARLASFIPFLAK